ncbi:hypothetical protein B0T14DRAFT_297792 [Immersiella caudata]|uniref:Secreted protein n=1 Tax=Immersiella caudata TaxID=314043 RepID=A0AA39WEY4_9PEZI|nr:hypothetical protein B0T14DRAFT_297792 [Immersiella caudata]
MTKGPLVLLLHSSGLLSCCPLQKRYPCYQLRNNLQMDANQASRIRGTAVTSGTGHTRRLLLIQILRPLASVAFDTDVPPTGATMPSQSVYQSARSASWGRSAPHANVVLAVHKTSIRLDRGQAPWRLVVSEGTQRCDHITSGWGDGRSCR